MPTGINLVPNNTGSSGVGSTLGTVTKRWDNIHVGTGSIDVISSSNSNLNILGDLTVVGDTTLKGDLTFGDSAIGDNLKFGAQISSSIIPDADGSFNLGNAALRWSEVHADLVQVQGNISASGTTFSDKFIGGKSDNSISSDSDYSSILGGQLNTITGSSSDWSIIGAGYLNTIEKISRYSFIGTGHTNSIYNAQNAFIGSGNDNTISASGGFIGAGKNHTIDDSEFSFIGSGDDNDIGNTAPYSFIGSGQHHDINLSTNAFIGGGYNNDIINLSSYSFIGAGYSNLISASNYSSIAGGRTNKAQGYNNVHILGSYITATQANTTFTENIIASGDISASGDLSIGGDTTLDGDLTVGGKYYNGDGVWAHIFVGDISASGDLYVGANDIYGGGTKRLTLGATNTFVGNISASAHSTGSFGRVEIGGDFYVGGNYITQSGQSHNFIGNISASGGMTLQSSMSIGTQTHAPNMELTVAGNISASGDLYLDGDVVDFENLPTSSAGLWTGRLYTQLGSQIFSGSAEMGTGGIYNAYTSSKFVLIK